MASIDIFPTSKIGKVSPLVFSGFLEHLGRCIYGGILPAGPHHFPYTSRNPCPDDKFVETPKELLTEGGFRKDVIELIRDELQTPLIRWPGGNFVQSYNWKDAIGKNRKKRPELAWGSTESNEFGTDEFIAFCREANIEPYIIFNMGTGTLADALDWVDYCNGTGDTYYANLRRENTGRDEPYNVKYWGLGNEVYGDWQVGQQTASIYASHARQWAKAIRMQCKPAITSNLKALSEDTKAPEKKLPFGAVESENPVWGTEVIDASNIVLISCGEKGPDSWDQVVLEECAEYVEMHSIHLYTGFGARDRTEKDKEFTRGVYGPEAAEHGIQIAKALIAKARYVNKTVKTAPIKLAFDEWGVWDETVGIAENGLEQFYTFADALAMASWLNVFIRQCDIVEMACIAQSVNVISPIITSPTGLFRQTIYHPLYLFSKYIRNGTAINVAVESPTFSGESLPKWVSTLRGHPKNLDVSAVVVDEKSVRIAVVNRSETEAFTDVPLRVAFQDVVPAEVEVHEMYHQDVKATNGWGKDSNKVDVTTRTAKWEGKWSFREHSFTLLILNL